MSKLGEESANRCQNFSEAFRVKRFTLLCAFLLFLIGDFLFLGTRGSGFGLFLGFICIALDLSFGPLVFLFLDGLKLFGGFFFLLREKLFSLLYFLFWFFF